MISLSSLWDTWSTPASAVIGGAFTWLGTLIKARLQEQRNTLDAGQQALRLVEACQTQQAYLTAAHERAVANELASRAREVATADMVQELHIDLVGARLRCHDVEMRFGLEPTLFPLVPAFPWRTARDTTPDKAAEIGGNAPGADPGLKPSPASPKNSTADAPTGRIVNAP